MNQWLRTRVLPPSPKLMRRGEPLGVRETMAVSSSFPSFDVLSDNSSFNGEPHYRRTKSY